MIAELAFALAALAPEGEPPRAPLVVTPRTVAWDELVRTGFDVAWILPAELPVAPRSSDDDAALRGAPGVALLPHVRALLAERGTGASASTLRSFGDVAAAVRRAEKDARTNVERRAARERIFAEVARCEPELWSAIGACARELCASERLAERSWNPDQDDPCDGLWFAQPLSLAGVRSEPWRSIDGSQLLQQACTLVFADLDAIKAAENDYTAYPARPGASYESIGPVAESYVRGKDARGEDFAALKLRFRCDLPFPFSHYDCELAILNRLDRDGLVRCDIVSRSKDFLWLAGRDTFVPVSTSDGAWVATLVVREFGFDLRGVPDGDDARRAGLRASLGSLKREAEALFAARGDAPRIVTGRVPPFEVRGAR